RLKRNCRKLSDNLLPTGAFKSGTPAPSRPCSSDVGEPLPAAPLALTLTLTAKNSPPPADVPTNTPDTPFADGEALSIRCVPSHTLELYPISQFPYPEGSV